MKKVLIIEASPRNGYCKAISDDIAEQLQDHYAVDSVSLRGLTIHPCQGCALCLFAGSSKCPSRNDDAKNILEKMTWADGVIFIVPNYSLSVPGLLKNLFDRLAYVFHRPRLFHKVILPIVVQGVIGGKKIAAYVNEVMGYWGMNPINGVVITGGVYGNKSKVSPPLPKDTRAIAAALARFSSELQRTTVKRPSYLSLTLFRMARTSIRYSQEALAPDKAYYEKMGWYEANYYYNVKLDPFRKITGVLVDRLAKRLTTKT